MIYYISGGERSGKSKFAQELAEKLAQNPIYIATARKWDTDFEKRIQKHQSDRNNQWTTFECEKYLSDIVPHQRVVVIDCVTLWITNFYADHQYQIAECFNEIFQEIDKLIQIPTTFIFISNELGMGLHADNVIGRKFVELQGWINQKIANHSNEAYFMISGIPLKIK